MAKKRTIAQKKNNPRYKNVHAPRGKHWCTYHKRYEPKENFASAKGKTNGLNNRCREGQNEYRRQHEAAYGKRHDITKTIRITPRAHAAAKLQSNSSGATLEEVGSTAIFFYLKYCCTYPKCLNPRGATGRCADHLLSVVSRNEND